MSLYMFAFTFGSQSMNTILKTPAAYNIDATAFQHTGTLYILWLSMKMNVSTALKLILSKMVKPCLTTSPWIQEPVCSSFKWLKKWKSTCKHKLLWSSIRFLGTHHAHTLLYPSCTWTTLGTVFTNHSSAMDKSWILSWWFLKTSSTTCTVFTHSWSAGLKDVIFMMDANQLLNSLHPLPKWCGLSTPSPNTNIKWQWISRVEMFCLYKLPHHIIFCMTKFPLSLPLHITLSPK